jgi:hypothetical protein
MTLLLFAAHQGEEFVLILPAFMLAGAFFIMRWANQPANSEQAESAAAPEREDAEESASDEDLIQAARAMADGHSLVAVGQVAVEPEHEAHSSDEPDHHERQGGGLAQRLTK